LLPHDLSRATPSEIAGRFGDAFAKQLLEIESGRWGGPVESAYGLHLVRITERVEGHVPELSEVREDVEREWLFLRRKESQEKFNLQLRDRYDVVIRWPNRQSDGTTAETSK
jgi:parvulin-like peptidyl-prolyl isomerase